jgi:23S rRNA pseudouridine1911/1915/1917 synthase
MEHQRLRLASKVPAVSAGVPLLDYLTARFRYRDRAGWEGAIARGEVRVDGARVTPWLRLRRGAELSYEAPHREPAAPTAMPVLLDTPDVLAVDKPAGLPVVADGAFIRNTVVAILRQQRAAWLQPVHRLDRETSGVLILGKNKAAANALQGAFQRGEVRKTYLAVVRGVVASDALSLTDPIGRAPHSRIALRRAALPPASAGAQPAHTDVTVLRRGARATLLEVTPHTGRTHQIRAHLEAIGHPLVGDVLYGRSDDEYLAWVHHVKAGGAADWPAGRDAPRQMLHCARVEVDCLGERLVITAPLPADLLAIVEH